MKKKILGILLTLALIASLCGTAFATEALEQEEETTESEIMDESDSAMIVDSFFSDSTTTFVKGAKTVGDITTGISDHTYTIDTATADTIADDISTDSDFITAITFDASDVDFDTVGEYTVIYRIFIDVDTLNDYIEDNDIDDVDISDITSDSIDVCVPCTVSIVDEDIETEDTDADTETQDIDDFTVVEINELTWTYEQINSIPDVITGIGNINPEDEDIDPEFDVDISIVDAVLYDMSSVDSEEPDSEDVAYYTYFDREALISYMEENDIDIETYQGLSDTTTDYIMVYYGPITELALADVIDGLTDHYVLVDSENIDYEYGITYNDDVVKSITTNSEDVDLSEVGTYDVEYTITIDKNALEEINDNDTTVSDDTDTEIKNTDIDSEAEDVDNESATEDIEFEDIETEDTNTDTKTENIDVEDTDSENVASDDAEISDEDLEDIIINKTVDVVDEATADELVKDGEVVWTDDNESYGDTEEDVAKNDTKEDTTTDEKTDDKDTEVATNDTDTNKNDDNGNSSNVSSSGSSNSSSSSSSSSSSANSGSSSNSSGSSNSGNSSNSSGSNSSNSGSSSNNSGSSSSGSGSSGNTQTHTHNYVGTVTKSATCGSAGTKTYTCSCGDSYTESIPATGNHSWVENTTTQEITEGYEVAICNVCGADITNNYNEHDKAHMLAGEGGGWHSEWRTVVVGTETVGTGTYYCSVCGATK